MIKFPEQQDLVESVYLDITDKPLPEKLVQSTRYIHFKTIAQGGKALIQSCKDLHLGRIICYKQLRPEFAGDWFEQQRFLREARISAILQHPNTVPTYELGRDSHGCLFFTMKLVHGYTLREVLNYRERYDLSQLLEVIVQVAYALEYAHKHGVVHRDIKPENILVGPFGEVLLLDWGLAKVWKKDDVSGLANSESGLEPSSDASSKSRLHITDAAITNMTDQDNLQGTVTYMSPEQLRRDPALDARSDIFSLGVVLYEILAGQTPAVADTAREMIDAIQFGAPVKPSMLSRLPIPGLLEDLVMQCLSKSPDERVADCSSLIRILQEEW
ncbi:MAG: serine/threonine-protein kinase [Pseudomonadales bacterium]|nr:serine/threonine-protein kinase [Pseudomonadales bacterium]